MTVTSISQSSATSTPASPANQLAGTQDEFLKLFMSQLQNQDPLNPQSNSDMVAQLAQFTQVEQGATTNTDLSSLVAAQTSSSNASLSSLVGRDCHAKAGDFTINGTGTPPPLAITSTSATKDAQVTITDANGKTIRTIAVPNGTSSMIQWDGRDSAGNVVPPGSYHVAVTSANNAAVTAQWQGRVDSVELSASGSSLRMGDILVAPSTISTIGATDTTSTTSTTTATTSAITAVKALQQGASK